MKKALISISFIVISLITVAQHKTNRINAGDYLKGDSASIIKQWIDEATVFGKKDPAKAEEYFFKAIYSATRNNNQWLLAEAKMKFAGFLFEAGTLHRSFANYNEAKKIYLTLNSQHDLALASLGVAKTQYYRGNYRLSIRNFLETITLAGEQNMKDVEGEASEYLGLLYNVTQNFSSGISFFHRSLEIKSKVGDDKGVIRMASKLSEMYYEKRRFDSALQFATIAQRRAESLEMKTDIYLARLARAAALIRLHKNDDARHELELLTSLKSSEKKDVNFFIRYNVLMGNFYLSQNETVKSRIHYDTAVNIAKRNNLPEMYAIIYKNMAGSYYELKDYKKAYEYFQQYNLSQSNLISGENARNTGDMEILVKADKSKDEINLLNTENRLKQLELLRGLEMRNRLVRENSLMDSIIQQEKILSDALVRENIYKSGQLVVEKKLRTTESAKLNDEKKLRWSLLAGLATALALGSIIFYQYRRQQKKKAIIEKQSEELQTLMKEIHHRVKNNLQIISSLLDLQSLTIKDSQAAEAVKDGKNRVQSMALIHQNLYREGNITGIKIESYILNLADSLFQSYNIRPEDIKMKANIEELNLDVDTVIPMGLILNELISNSLKYAFKNKTNGEILVELKKVNNNAILMKVKDNGAGFPENTVLSGSDSFGMKIINALTRKLRATLNMYNDNGACVELLINRYKIAVI